MLKPYEWRRFPKDFMVIQIGFALFGLAIAIFIRANLGTSPWAVFEVALINYLPITPGQATILVGAVVLLLALAMRQQIGWGTIANIICIGLWQDLFLQWLPAVRDNWILQVPYLLTGVTMMGAATAIYIGVNAGAGPRDSVMLGLSRNARLSVRVARTMIEVVVVVAGWLLGGPLGVGTLIYALTIGPAVQAFFRLFRVNAQRR
jgi:uncharacterized membrane protein YczE